MRDPRGSPTLSGVPRPEKIAHDVALLTAPQLARRSGIGAARIRRAIKAGELRAVKAGKTWLRVRLSDFDAWLEALRFVPPAPTVAVATDADAWARAKIADEREAPRG